MSIKDVIEVVAGETLSLANPDSEISSLIIDSRKPFVASGALFFATKGEHHDGHDYVKDVYAKGCRNFIVEDDLKLTDANIIKVMKARNALQAIAKHHRGLFDIDIIGITGSNAKTIVKEWLYSCLASSVKITKSPHSYNSQIGVPLSVWNLSDKDDLGIFEAGISTTGEMEKLASIIQPTIGIFTNLGSAHDEGFSSRKEKFEEKSLLFEGAKLVIYNSDQQNISFGKKGFSWGRKQSSHVVILNENMVNDQTELSLQYNNETIAVSLPFTYPTYIENAMHCISYMLLQGYSQSFIQSAVNRLQPLAMRMELKRALNGSFLIDDTYNNDLAGLEQALNFLMSQQQRPKKVVILSDILQSGLESKALYAQVAQLLVSAKVDLTVAIGDAINTNQKLFKSNTLFYKSTESCIKKIDPKELASAIILVKGARSFGFERISKLLEEKVHGTVLEINLDALTNNLNFYRSVLNPTTKLMVMVKAFAYGSGSYEIANLLQFHRVDYLGVAYADEGVELRKNGIHLPILVMNSNVESFEDILKYNLEPAIYDKDLLLNFIQFLADRKAAIHIEIDTGMKRLGFEEHELADLIAVLKENSNIKVKSIFSHLAGADDDTHEEFSHQQAESFESAATYVSDELGYKPLWHLLNSPGIIRFSHLQYDMVRLGIGLHGIETNGRHQDELASVSSLKTVVSQVHHLKKGESIGYGRKSIAKNDMTIATIAIGYADGFSRAFSNGVGEVFIQGKRAPVLGNVCMDMTMVDISGLKVAIGDEVEIFGNNISIVELANKINTIPYEILTNVSQRVKRVYYQE